MDDLSGRIRSGAVNVLIGLLNSGVYSQSKIFFPLIELSEETFYLRVTSPPR
jgi:hypothetical protein